MFLAISCFCMLLGKKTFINIFLILIWMKEKIKKLCVSCGKEIGRRGVVFACPSCGAEIARCFNCKSIDASYICKCGFEGP